MGFGSDKMSHLQPGGKVLFRRAGFGQVFSGIADSQQQCPGPIQERQLACTPLH
jgi:hypothetical protein